jgi:threonine/homoserine/homoserine lactone efflux protein
VVAVLFLGTVPLGTVPAFLGVAALVIVTPGQDTALTIRNTLFGGRRGGVLTAAGVCSGQFVWAVATSFGLAALLVASEVAFQVLRWFGATYLVFLGLQSLYRALRRVEWHASRPRTKTRPYRQGVISNLGNPKMAIFFPSLLPQFAHSFGGLLSLGLVFVAMTFGWLTAIAYAGDVFRRPKLKRALDAVVGTVLVAFGVRQGLSPSGTFPR